MYKFRTTDLVEHENVVTTYVIIEVSLALASIEKNKVLHGMHSCSDTNVRNYFVTEKMLKHGVRSQKKVIDKEPYDRIRRPVKGEQVWFKYTATIIRRG